MNKELVNLMEQVRDEEDAAINEMNNLIKNYNKVIIKKIEKKHEITDKMKEKEKKEYLYSILECELKELYRIRFSEAIRLKNGMKYFINQLK